MTHVVFHILARKQRRWEHLFIKVVESLNLWHLDRVSQLGSEPCDELSTGIHCSNVTLCVKT